MFTDPVLENAYLAGVHEGKIRSASEAVCPQDFTSAQRFAWTSGYNVGVLCGDHDKPEQFSAM